MNRDTYIQAQVLHQASPYRILQNNVNTCIRVCKSCTSMQGKYPAARDTEKKYNNNALLCFLCVENISYNDAVNVVYL